MADGNNNNGKPSGKVRHINKKRLFGTILTGAAIIGSIIGIVELKKYYDYATTPDIDDSISNIFNAKSDVTVFDNVVSQDGIIELDKLDISASEYSKIVSLDIDKYYTEDLNEQEVILDKDEIQKLINRYNELKQVVDYKTPSQETNEFYYVVSQLESYKNIFDKQIYLNGVKLINATAVDFIKSLIVDAQNLPINDISKIEVSAFYTENKDMLIKYTDLASGKVYYLEPYKYSLLNKLINSLIELNELNDKYLTGELKNIVKLSNKEDETLNYLKACMLCSYTINDGVIYQNEKRNELVKKID